MKKLVIFDLDGTLLNTISDLGAACNHVLEDNGYPTHPLDAYRWFVGRGIRNLVISALAPNTLSDEAVDRLLAQFKTYYTAHKTDLTRPYKGIDALLAALHKSGVRLAVASNKFQQGTEELIRHYWGDQLFDVVLGQREGVPVKPDPQIVYDILQKTSIPAKDCLYIGDTNIDMQTAAAAGIESIGVSWGFRSVEELQAAGACHIVGNPEEILKWI